MQTKQFEYKGANISYRAKGEGPLLVLLHGFGEDGSVWENQFNLFPNHRLIIPDLPGSGRSEMIDDMSMEGLADAVKALIDTAALLNLKAPLPPKGEEALSIPQRGSGKTQTKPVVETANNLASPNSGPRSDASDTPPLGGRGAVLIGHSMGGYITLAFVEKYPDSVNAFGLFHSTAFADSEEKKETRQKGIAFIEAHGGYEFLKTTTPNLFAPATRSQKPQLVHKQIEAVRNAGGAALVRYYRSMMERPDRTAVLKASKVPVLFVMGRHDHAVPLDDGLKQCHLPQLSYIELLENAGHMGMMEEAEATNAVLTKFMTSLDRRT